MALNFAPVRAQNITGNETPRTDWRLGQWTRPGRRSKAKTSQRQYKSLEDRYGKIGISAVAAAVRHQGEQRNAGETRTFSYDSD